MYRYAKYCPVAATTKLMGDPWTPLIVREPLYGTGRFNQLVRNIPGISRTLLAGRLRSLERAGVVRCERGGGRNESCYVLTESGRDLAPIVEAMNAWGTRWAAPDVALEEIDPLILICMLKSCLRLAELPRERVVIEVFVTGGQQGRAWLMSERQSVTMCFEPRGYEVDLWVRGDLLALYRIWSQQQSMAEALASGRVEVDGRRDLLRAFVRWFDGRAGVAEAAEAGAAPAIGRPQPSVA
ncbi:MAG TPA: helix-turn-helix domain-containing protein [Dehalococcoidia bacterium]|nr:helix-turn-helix domain-containing protein [Dehalococcoidia bacterium]